MIFNAIDNINENLYMDNPKRKKNYEHIAKSNEVKMRFKVFKKRNSCLWNYFTYHKHRNQYTFDLNLSKDIVNINLLDISCGDYHSLILLEVDKIV